jgi:hypothetical protein
VPRCGHRHACLGVRRASGDVWQAERGCASPPCWQLHVVSNFNSTMPAAPPARVARARAALPPAGAPGAPLATNPPEPAPSPPSGAPPLQSAPRRGTKPAPSTPHNPLPTQRRRIARAGGRVASRPTSHTGYTNEPSCPRGLFTSICINAAPRRALCTKPPHDNAGYSQNTSPCCAHSFSACCPPLRPTRIPPKLFSLHLSFLWHPAPSVETTNEGTQSKELL